MSQPPSPYERSYSFTDNSTANPTSQQPGQKIDQELNAARTAINATIARLGEVQADDGKVRNSALNIQTIAEAVEPLLTTAPVQAVNAAGASQVAAVNTAGTTQVANVNAAAAAGAALIAAETTTPNAVTILSAQQTAVIAAQEAQLNAANSLTNRNLTYNLYVQTNTALSAAQLAEMHAEGFANSAADAQSAAATEASNAINAQNAAQGAAADANASKMAALEAKGDAEAAANTAQTIVTNGAAAINAEVQPYLDAADASATSASASAFAALASQNAAAASATNSAASASSAAAQADSASNSALAASNSAVSASSSATSAANSAAAINPASYAPAVHTHNVADITGLSGALTGYATLNGSTFTGKVTVPASTASAAGFRILGSSTNPTAAVPGDIWYNNSTQRLLFCVSPSVSWNIATETWIASQNYINAGYLTSNSYFKFGDQGTQAWYYASKKDWSGSAPSAIIVGGLGSYQYEGTATLSSVAYDGWTLNFNASYGGGFSYYSDSGSKTHYVTYDTSFDLSGIISNISSLGVPGFSFSYSDDGNGPYYSTLNNTTLAYPTIPVSNSDRFIFDLYDRQVELARTSGAGANSVQVYDGNTGMLWGKPWQFEGYATASALSNYASLGGANFFTNKQTFMTPTTVSASFRIPHGSAPTTPAQGDVWSTTAGMFVNINGTTRTLAFLSGGTYTGQIVTLASATGGSGFRLPHGVAPTTPVNGDVWTTSSQLAVRINSTTQLVPLSGLSFSYSTNAKQTFGAHSAGAQGSINIPPATGTPSWVSGDIAHSTTTNQIMGHSNSMISAMTAVRAFVNFNGVGTVAIRSSFNVTSITDNAVGNYTVNLSSALVDANGCPVACAGETASAAASVSVSVNTIVAGSFRVYTATASSATLSDRDIVTAVVLR